MVEPIPELLTIEEVAAALLIKKPRAYELVRRKILPAVYVLRQLRVRRADVIGFIEGGGQSLGHPIGGRKPKSKGTARTPVEVRPENPA